jgi:ABC-type multidrug transport system fused ATPase/permease subunit
MWRIYLATFLTLVTAATQVAPTMVLNSLIAHFEGSVTLSDALLWINVTLMLVLPLIGGIASAHMGVLLARISLHLKAVLTTAIYRKSLTFKNDGSFSTGQVQNLMSIDSQQLQRFAMAATFLVSAPLLIIVSLWLITLQVGVSGWAGVGFLLCLVPVNGLVFGCAKSLRSALLEQTDARVRLMTELLQGIRIVKMFAWEEAMVKKVSRIRARELVVVKKVSYVLAIGFSLILLSAPVLLPVIVFADYTRLGGTLTAAKAFTTIALFGALRFSFAFLPMILLSWAQAAISMGRISRFLTAPDMVRPPLSDDPEHPIVLDDVTLRWPSGGGTEDTDASKKSKKKKKEESGGKPDVHQVNRAIAAADTEQRGGSCCGCCSESNFMRLRKGEEPLSEPLPLLVTSPDEEDDDDEGVVVVGSSAASGSAVAEVEMTKPADSDETAPSDGPPSSPEKASSRDEKRPQISNVSLKVKRGELLAIVGRVGSGKSTLLAGMLGEVPVESGSLKRAECVAYVPQTAWIINESVRNNVMFGEPMEEERLARAMGVAQLGPDLKQLPKGEHTLIGERGVSLSGGQKQRVSLARAVYADVPVVLMDDPLSAVDAHVGEKIFADLISGALKDKTRVLVTNALQYLPRCDRVAVLIDGEIRAIGSFDEVRESDAYRSASAEIIEVERRRRQSSLDEASLDAEGLKHALDLPPTADQPEVLPTTKAAPDETAAAAAAEASAKPSSGTPAVPSKPQAADTMAGTRTEESRETGSVSSAAYWYYFTSAKLFSIGAIFVCQLLGRGFELGGSFWVSYWAEQAIRPPFPGQPEALWYVNIYALIGCLGVLVITVRSCYSAECRVRASYLLHERLLRHVVRAPAAWFDDTPLGRILNRFSGDMEKIDEQLPPTLTQMLGTGVSVIGALIAVAVTSNGVLVIALVPLMAFYYYIQWWFRRSSTELQRVESVTRSPIYVSFDATLDGLTSIRAYHRQENFIRKSNSAINANSVPYILSNLASQWLAMRLDAIGAVIAFGVAAVAAATTGFIPAGWVGIGLSTALEMTAFLKHGVRMLAQTETMMNAVERVKEYSEDTPVEAKLVLSPQDVKEDPSKVIPAPEWPDRGELEFKDVRLRYGLKDRQGPEVLQGVSFHVPPRAKVGIVGRTGSGKSSSVMALFRLVELSGGSIVLDGLDISRTSLSRLRSSLAIVPQDPVLFSPNVRSNLDPFNRYSDKQMRAALKRVELDTKLSLDDEVLQGGSNLSQGTRQLICIARAILRRPRVLVMDEATASVDERTDEIVQRAMRLAFKDATVLVIAHRLRTIADSDLVLVLDGGKVAEFDHPEVLLDDKTKYPASLFRALVTETREQADEIRALARRAAETRTVTMKSSE